MCIVNGVDPLQRASAEEVVMCCLAECNAITRKVFQAERVNAFLVRAGQVGPPSLI